MKSYSQYQNNLNELYMKEYNLLNEETQQKIVEWNELDIESQQTYCDRKPSMLLFEINIACDFYLGIPVR